VETWDAIRARRNVRAYRPDPVAASDLDRITEAGRRAPSASNRQHWDFVVVTDPDELRALSTVWRGAGHIAGAAAAIALVLPQTDDDRTRLLDYYDLGQATYAIAVAAADLGLGTPPATVGGPEDPGCARRSRCHLPPRRGLPGGPAAAAHRESQPPPGRRGRSSRPLVTSH
jgi:nitroreductase